MWEEFKKFAIKGSVIDLAIGIIIGGAFGKIVTSFVNDLVMPVISQLTGKIDFSNKFLALDGNIYKTLEEAKSVGAITLNYGNFITIVVDFLIIAFALFAMINQVNKVKERTASTAAPEPPKPTTKTCEFCQSQISIKAIKCPFCTSYIN